MCNQWFFGFAEKKIKLPQKKFPDYKICVYLQPQFQPNAEIAQLVEHDLAKVGVAGSSPVFRSK
jgi:hypothetical protein